LTALATVDGREIYAGNTSGTSGVAVISTASNTVVATIAVRFPRDFVFTSDSRRAYVISDRSLVVIDTGTRRVIKSIALGGFPYAPAMSPDGSRVYVGFDRASDNARHVAVVSTATNTVTRNIPLVDGRAASHVAFAPNGRIALVNTGDVIDTGTGTVARAAEVGQVDPGAVRREHQVHPTDQRDVPGHRHRATGVRTWAAVRPGA
jgi:YVTN family beta-propeller protein